MPGRRRRNASAAFNIDKIREDLLRRVEIPPALLTKAFKRIDEALDAVQTHHFAFRGEVVDIVKTVDYRSRRDAARLLLQASGLGNKDTDSNSGISGTTVSIDPVTGVVKLTVGAPVMIEDDEPEVINATPAEPEALVPAIEQESIEIIEEPEIIRGARSNSRIPADVRALIFGKE